MTRHQYAKTAGVQEDDGGSAWRDAQGFAAMMAQKLAEKVAQAAVQVLAHLTVQHWMHNHHHHYRHHAQMSRHLQTDITARLQMRKETKT